MDSSALSPALTSIQSFFTFPLDAIHTCPRRSLFRHHSPSCSPFYRPLLAPHSNSPGATFKPPWRSPQTTQALSLYPTCPNALPHVSRGLAPRGPTALPHLTQRRCPTCPTALPHLPKQIWPRAPKGWRQGSLGIASREFQTRVSPTAEKCQGTAIFKIGTAKNSNQRDKMSRLIDRRVSGTPVGSTGTLPFQDRHPPASGQAPSVSP
jgi:hypothetical protein